MIKILLADDHSLVRDGLRRIVEAAGDMEVIEEASDGREVIQKVRNAPPDVAVIDISMPGMDGLEVISQLHIYFPDLPILVLDNLEVLAYPLTAYRAQSFGLSFQD